MAQKNFIKSFKKMFSSKGVDPSKMEITPYRDWRILIGIFSISLIASLGFNIFMSIEINSDNFFSSSTKVVPGISLNKGGLEKILTDFANKEEAFRSATTTVSKVIDPSL